MAEIVRMPKLSDTMTEGVVAKWHKKVGDKVKSGDLLADIETDKATMEFESFQDGVLLHIGVQETKAAPVDAVLAILGKEGEDVSGLLNQSNSSQPTTTQKQDISVTESPKQSITAAPSAIPAGVEIVRMPKLSDTMTDGVVAKWHKKVGDKVKSGELLADIETDKATMEFESFQDGVLIYIGVEEKGSAPVNSILAILGKGGEDVNAILNSVDNTQKTTPAATKPEPSVQKTDIPSVSVHAEPSTIVSNDSRIKASPLAKALAKEEASILQKLKGRVIMAELQKLILKTINPHNKHLQILVQLKRLIHLFPELKVTMMHLFHRCAKPLLDAY